jgi:membrane protease YdiL (CAAX protease family)
MIVFMFAWPTAWYMLLIYVLARPFVPEGGIVPTWLFLTILALGTGTEGVVGLLLLRREGYRLTLDALRDRIRWQWPRGWKAWGVVLLVLVVTMGLGFAMAPLTVALAGLPGFIPPTWWPPVSNPLAEVTGPADLFPDINLEGNFGFVIIFFVVTLLFNIFGEEIYYRGYLQPRMRGVFGRWDWVANGVGFALKHLYQRWLYPGLLIPGLAMAFLFGPLGSLPLAMIFHWIGNFLFITIMLIMTAFGAA